MLLFSGRIPTSSKTHTFGYSIVPNALKNHRWELIFFWYFSFMQKMICVGTMPVSPSSRVGKQDSHYTGW